MKTLPAPANELADCEADAKCLLSKLGLKDVAGLFDPVSDLFNTLSEVKTMFIDMVGGLQCSKWGTQTVPITSVVSKLGVELPGEVCDIDIPYCEGEYSTFVQAGAVLRHAYALLTLPSSHSPRLIRCHRHTPQHD